MFLSVRPSRENQLLYACIFNVTYHCFPFSIETLELTVVVESTFSSSTTKFFLLLLSVPWLMQQYAANIFLMESLYIFERSVHTNGLARLFAAVSRNCASLITWREVQLHDWQKWSTNINTAAGKQIPVNTAVIKKNNWVTFRSVFILCCI